MDTRQGIKLALDMADMISMAYLQDLSDEELLRRASPGINHIKWQLGHLIAAENQMINAVSPGASPELPEGFAERYSKETASSDDPSAFDSKADLLALHEKQRAATLAALEATSDEALDGDSGVEYVPTVGGIFSMQGSHWLMHAGQWAVVRRQLGREPLF